jgi:myo-inositol 2-dehydrogenase / D-chiro-inositol 1-dehydrogenase
MTKTKVALLGAGFIADIHIESYQRFIPEAEIVAVYSRDPKRAEAFAKKHGIARWFGHLEQAITESGCEVVDICLPNVLHHRAVLAAARAGKHVSPSQIDVCRGAVFRPQIRAGPQTGQ